MAKSQVLSDEVFSNEVIPDEVIPDEVFPDGVFPDEVIPDEVFPDEVIPDQRCRWDRKDIGSCSRIGHVGFPLRDDNIRACIRFLPSG
jgi:hypothetical protein